MGLVSSLRVRLALLVVAVALPLTVLLAYQIQQQFIGQVTTISRAALILSEPTAQNSDQIFNTGDAPLAKLASTAEVVEARADACPASLQQVRELRPEFANIGFIDESGTIVCSGVPQPSGPASITGTPIYRTTAQREAAGIQGLQVTGQI